MVRSTFSIEAAQRKIWGVETASSRFLTQDTRSTRDQQIIKVQLLNRTCYGVPSSKRHGVDTLHVLRPAAPVLPPAPVIERAGPHGRHTLRFFCSFKDRMSRCILDAYSITISKQKFKY